MTNTQKVDLSRYKAAELAASIGEILAIPATLRGIVTTVLIWSGIALLINIVLYGLFHWTPVWFTAAAVYSICVFGLLGFAHSLIGVARVFVTRIERLLKLTIETARDIAIDCRAVQAGSKRPPSAAELIEYAHTEVIIPAVETSVANSLGIFGTPLLWIYRRTIAGAIRILIARMKAGEVGPEQEETFAVEAELSAEGFAKAYERNEKTMQIAWNATGYIAAGLRWTVLMPARVLFVMATGPACLILIIIWALTLPVGDDQKEPSAPSEIISPVIPIDPVEQNRSTDDVNARSGSPSVQTICLRCRLGSTNAA